MISTVSMNSNGVTLKLFKEFNLKCSLDKFEGRNFTEYFNVRFYFYFLISLGKNNMGT